MLQAHSTLRFPTGICLFISSSCRFRLPASTSGWCKASLVTDSDSFQVGKLIGTYGFINVTSYSGLEYGVPDEVGKFRAQDVGEGNVRIRLYEGRIVRGPLRDTPVIFKVYPRQMDGDPEADMMAANELSVCDSLQSNSKGALSQNIQILLGGFEDKMGEKWLAFRNDGKYTAADYAKVTSERMLKDNNIGSRTLWNRFEREETLQRRRYFVTKLFQGVMQGLAYLHDNEILHQSLGPASIVLNTLVEKEAVYLVPRVRDLAFAVDIRYSKLEGDSNPLSGGLWRRAYAAGAYNPLEKRAFGIADDIYEAGLLLMYIAFVPFCEAGAADALSLRRLLENTFQLDVEALREYCLADERLVEAINFLDLGHGAGWELLAEMLKKDYKKRPTAEAVLKHRFMSGATAFF